MGVGDEFKRNPTVFVVFFLGGGMLLMVNQLEGSYARTLIQCDTPVSVGEGELFSGSANCGDRNFVINEGARLSATAQALEMLSKVVIMTAAAVLSDMYGRRFVMLIGLTCTTASVFLFLVGSMLPSIAHICFYSGQCLQGAHAMEIVGLQILADLSFREDTDTQSIQALGGMMDALNKLLFGILLFVVQGMELTSYTNTWLFSFLVNGLVLALTFLYLPETCTSKPETSGSFLNQVAGQLKDYLNLLRTKGISLLMVSFVFKAMSDGVFAVIQPASMAFYGMSVQTFYVYFLPVMIIAVVCGGVVVGMTAKHGEKNAYWQSSYYLFGCNLLLLGVPSSKFFLFGFYWAVMIINPGFEGLIAAMIAKYLGESTSKYIALRALGGYGIQIICNPLYAYSFDAKATSYIAMNKPFLIALLFRLAELVVSVAPVWGTYTFLATTFDALAEERQQKTAEGDSTKTSDEKKEK